MAAEPKRRHSKARKRTRRASIKLESKSLVKCPECGELRLSHLACKSCGAFGQKKTTVKTTAKVTRVS